MPFSKPFSSILFYSFAPDPSLLLLPLAVFPRISVRFLSGRARGGSGEEISDLCLFWGAVFEDLFDLCIYFVFDSVVLFVVDLRLLIVFRCFYAVVLNKFSDSVVVFEGSSADLRSDILVFFEI